MHVADSVCVCEREYGCICIRVVEREREKGVDWGDNTESSYIIFHIEKNNKGKLKYAH